MTTSATRLAVMLAFAALPSAMVLGQDVTLSTDCEVGFRQFIRMAQTGALGAEVTNANVSVDGDQIRIELVRAAQPSRFLQLTDKRSPQRFSRYFDIVAGQGATVAEVERVGKVLDDVFHTDPFEIAAFERSPTAPPLPRLVDAWAYGGIHAVRRVLELGMMGPVSTIYVVAVTGVVVIGMIVSVIVLCLAGVQKPDQA